MKLLILLLIPISVLCNSDLQADVAHLTNVLFANLKEDPYLQNATIEQSKTFLDKQVANYMSLMKKTHGLIEHSLTRRSLPTDESTTLIRDDLGIYMLDGITPLYSMHLQAPKDIHLFEEHGIWYAAVLEGKNMVIYKFKDENFSEVAKVSVINGVKLGLTPLLDGICIVVAENNTASENVHEKTRVYHFKPKTESIEKIQHLDAEYANDVVLWSEHQETFMALAIFMKNQSVSYEIEVPIYQWFGLHFDIIGFIKTSGAQKITPFIIENSHFLAVANFQNNFGKTNIYSEVYKYNRHLNKFESYQKIITEAAVDVKYFYFKGEKTKEHFLVFANLFEEDENGNRNYETNSVVYKYVDGYFIPFQSFKLNGVSEWLPVTGPNGEFVLFASCKYQDIKIFQYDGWTFTESKIQYTDEALSKGVVSMRTYAFHNKTLLVVANKNDNGNMINIFELKFANKKLLNKFHDENLLWCREHLEKYKSIEASKSGSKVSKREVESDKISELRQKLKFYEDEVESMEEQLRMAFNSSADLQEIDGDLQINELNLVNNSAHLESVTSTFINEENTSNFLESVINITHDFIVENAFQLENVIAPEITPLYVNNNPASSIVYTDGEERLNEVNVNGNVIFQKGLVLDGKLNGVKFTKENILLNEGNQSLSSLELNILAAEMLDADFINDIDMSQIDPSQPIIVDKISVLNVQTAHIKGLINNVNITNLNQYALRASGNQTITSKYKFDSLHVDGFNTQILSGKNLAEEIVLIDEGEFVLDQEAEFTESFSADVIVISNNFNHVLAVDGVLDVLLVNSSEVQHVTGFKEFDDVELMNPIKLGGRITNPKIDQMNPVKVTNDEIVISGDYIVRGNLEVEQFLQAFDIRSANVSVSNLQSNGILLTDDVIPCHLQFLQQLNVQDITADAINGVTIDSIVVMDTDQEQVITGCKTIQGDVFVTESTKLEYVNGIHLPTLESDVLRITGDQTITGNHQFENIIANRVFNVKTVLGDRLWEDVVTTKPEQMIADTAFITGTLQLDELETDSLFSNSLINGYNFTFMIEDSIFRNYTLGINGPITFKNLIIEELTANNLDLNFVPRAINESSKLFQFDRDIILSGKISIHEIYFTDFLNNMARKDFEDHWISDGNELVFRGDQTFNKITIFGNLFVESGFINNVNIARVSEDSVKIDEDSHIPTATFLEGLASIYEISLEGQFESLDLNDIVLSDTLNPQIISDEITFKSDVSVNGEVVFNGLVSGLNVTEFCEFSYNREKEDPINLQVNGNVYFVKGPIIKSVDNIPIKYLLDNIWFTTQDCTLSREIEFGNIVFEEDLTVQQFVDDVKIQLIANIYLSKTKDQNISAFYNFDDTVLFGKGIYATRATIGGAIGGINLGEFVTTALLNNTEQVFENTVYLEECEVREFLGEYLVNDLNLETDVMRYDQNNVVTGKKVISGVAAYMLKIEKNVMVQDVKLIPWMFDSVLKSGTFQLQGNVSFFNETIFSKGIGCQQNVNGMKFNQETIMLKSKPQTITAPKNFTRNDNETMKFHSLNVKGLINGIDINNLIQQQAYKNVDIVFKSPIYFNGSIATPNMEVEKLYQGVNVTDLVNNVTQSSTTHNYTENFEKLLQISSEVRESLQARAYFIHDYKVKQIYQNVDFVLPVSFPNDNNQYLAYVAKEDYKITINFDVWDSNTEIFRRAPNMTILMPINLRFIKEVKFTGSNYWYIEYEKTVQDNYFKYEGKIFEIKHSGLEEIGAAISHNGTEYVSSMVLPLLNKCVFMLFRLNAAIFCQQFDDVGASYWNPIQNIETFDSVEGKVANVNNDTYIFIINGDTLNKPSSVDFWKFDINTKLFQKEQSIYMPCPTSISTIRYKNFDLFAVGSRYTPNYEGMVTIRKYDTAIQQYIQWQDIRLHVPMQVLFAELPTQELVLYVSTNNPMQPLIIYQYEGISKLMKKIVAMTVPHSSSIRSFNTPDLRHFILAQIGNKVSIIEAIFKGQMK